MFNSNIKKRLDNIEARIQDLENALKGHTCKTGYLFGLEVVSGKRHYLPIPATKTQLENLKSVVNELVDDYYKDK